MFNTSDVIARLRDCETVVASSVLSDTERCLLLAEILAGIPDPQFCTSGPAVALVRTSIARQLKEIVDGAGSPKAKVKGRTTKRVEDAPEVAAA